ncbi:MAG TPA: helix-turn-helix domain-containing protein [Gaiellaceae bacterium]|jgi:DNA-binding transcriptional ArsR family regulator|nr:helix-turn-helix domain-containing protein [Gaiellaceae bacterium]
MAAREPKPLLDVLTLDRPEQLKALGHPLRLRVLETLGTEREHMTNRELANKLGVDPGHLHFHVRMLLRAGLIELAGGGQGREKPYRAVARTVRVAPELLASGFTTDLRAAMLEEVQRGWAEHGAEGTFRSAQVTARIPPERAIELIQDLAERAREDEDPSLEPLIITAVLHPPTPVPAD